MSRESAHGAPWASALGAELGALLERGAIALSVKELAGGTLVFANETMAALHGRPVGELPGQREAALFDAVTAAALRAAELAAIGRAAATSSDIKLKLAGVSREFQVLCIALRTAAEAAPTHLASLWIEQSEARRREDQLRNALAQLEAQQLANEELRRDIEDSARRDRLTGLATPAGFDDQLRREIDLSQREHREFALVSIELDPPGEALQAAGEGAWPRVLESLGSLLRNNTRLMDASCRLDDERFMVLLSGIGLATAHARMEQLRRQCTTQIVVHEGRELSFSVSMGVASFPHTASSQEALRQASDAALAQARARGGNRVALASIRLEET